MRNRKSERWLPILLLAGLAVAMSGCSGSDDGPRDDCLGCTPPDGPVDGDWRLTITVFNDTCFGDNYTETRIERIRVDEASGVVYGRSYFAEEGCAGVGGEEEIGVLTGDTLYISDYLDIDHRPAFDCVVREGGEGTLTHSGNSVQGIINGSIEILSGTQCAQAGEFDCTWQASYTAVRCADDCWPCD